MIHGDAFLFNADYERIMELAGEEKISGRGTKARLKCLLLECEPHEALKSPMPEQRASSGCVGQDSRTTFRELPRTHTHALKICAAYGKRAPKRILDESKRQMSAIRGTCTCGCRAMAA